MENVATPGHSHDLYLYRVLHCTAIYFNITCGSMRALVTISIVYKGTHLDISIIRT